MSFENEQLDRKSLRSVTGRMADWDALARNCVCFANGSGGRILIGIEDNEAVPRAGQTVEPSLLDAVRKRVNALAS